MTENYKKQLMAQKGDATPNIVAKAEVKTTEKKLTTDRTRVILRQYLKADCDPDQIFKKATELLSTFHSDSKEGRMKTLKALHEDSDKTLMPLGLETHYPLAETVGKRLRPLAIEVARQIVSEYDCKTASEKVLAEIIAGSYARIIEYGARFNECTRIEFLSSQKNGYYMMLSKELDRANRQLITALATLKQIKNPTIEVNVKAKNAFIAQNQQINNPPPDETNNSQANGGKAQ